MKYVIAALITLVLIQWYLLYTQTNNIEFLQTQKESFSQAARLCSESVAELSKRSETKKENAEKQVEKATVEAKVFEKRAKKYLTKPEPTPANKCSAEEIDKLLNEYLDEVQNEAE